MAEGVDDGSISSAFIPGGNEADCGEGRLESSDVEECYGRNYVEGATVAGRNTNSVTSEQLDNPDNLLVEEYPTQLDDTQVGSGYSNSITVVDNRGFLMLNENEHVVEWTLHDLQQQVHLLQEWTLHDLQQQVYLLQEDLRQSEAEKRQILSEFEKVKNELEKVRRTSMANSREQSTVCSAIGASCASTSVTENLLGGTGPLQEPTDSWSEPANRVDDPTVYQSASEERVLVDPSGVNAGIDVSVLPRHCPDRGLVANPCQGSEVMVYETISLEGPSSRQPCELECPMQRVPVDPSGPNVTGINNAFLARNSRDRGLVASLYQISLAGLSSRQYFPHPYLEPSSHPEAEEHCCSCCARLEMNGARCRPDSGHDECCICMEDALSVCKILPCSHKVHAECLIAMIQGGELNCPTCGYPFLRTV